MDLSWSDPPAVAEAEDNTLAELELCGREDDDFLEVSVPVLEVLLTLLVLEW